MLRLYFFSALFLSLAAIPSFAQDVVRLPGQGEVKRDVAPQLGSTDRLIPGGGLLLSFDTDRDGRVSDEELMTGIERAFAAADNNQDGYLTPLEQISWSESLPTRDASLSNPARFDPNLDRRVNAEEFSDVIVSFADDLADEESGEVIIASLKAKRRPRPDGESDQERPRQRRAGGGDPQQQQSRSGS
ncbi:MAG: hypothetical protein AAF292_09910 [Pseudomonadota bacterium]